MTFPKEIFLFLTFPSSGDIMSQVKEALKQFFSLFQSPLALIFSNAVFFSVAGQANLHAVKCDFDEW